MISQSRTNLESLVVGAVDMHCHFGPDAHLQRSVDSVDAVRQAREANMAAVVLDPPYGGAAAQIGQVAAAGAPRVIYVSCNPVALARDASVLGGAGYAVATATPIDQFLWSARLESVVVFAVG